jgi:8-oxo-dGTP pyrophosphatase MutT (NUDIX family)
MFSLFIHNLTKQLSMPLPGEAVQFEMAHVKRETVNWKELHSTEYKVSAVLLVIFPNEKNEPSFLLIKRPTYEGHHSGQMALPGGKAEFYDANEEATAMREFKEETGCTETPIIIGKCTPIFIPVSKFIVHPFVGYMHKKPTFNYDVREVEQLIECPMSTLLNPTIVKETMVNPLPNITFKTPYFDIENNIVWGATAMILNEFKTIAQEIKQLR